MRISDIVGYVADEQAWCIPCVEKVYMPRIYIDQKNLSTVGHNNREIMPIFAGTEYNAQPCCAGCDADLPVLVLPLHMACGLYHTGTRCPRISMHMSAEAKELARR